jgi:hypothetical protein
MTKSEFQQFYNFDDETMALLELLLKLFKGKIVSIKKKVDKEQS